MIYSFSGTGNSDYIAQCLREALGESDNEEILGIVFPVHAWGIPLMMEDWLEHIFGDTTADLRPWKHVFLVMTCGTDAGYCEQTFPYAFDAAYTIQMPNTYIGMPFFGTDSLKTEQKKIEKARKRVEYIAERVKVHTKEMDIKRGPIPHIYTYVLRPFFAKHLAQPRHLHLEMDKCNGCGKCAKVCPLLNITMEDHHPVHGDKCCLCLGCYHNCPKKSIWAGPWGKGKGQKQLAKKK